MNTLKIIVAELGIKTKWEAFIPSWSDSQRSFSGGNNIFFLEDEYIRDICSVVGYSTELRDAFIQGKVMFKELPLLRELIWHCYHYTFKSSVSTKKKQDVIKSWPELPDDLHRYAPMFYAYVFLGGVKYIQELHRKRGIQKSITCDTLFDLELVMRKYYTENGKWGFKSKFWLCSHFLGELFRLGRLQFRFETFPYDFSVFRNRFTKSVKLLAGPKMEFRSDGQFKSCNGNNDSKVWTAKLTFADDKITGNLISPKGKVLADIIKLPAPEWKLVLKKGYHVLGIHIPASGKMEHKECGNSFNQAIKFFTEKFRNRPFKAFTCSSWILDNQFDDLLPKKSNIRKFLQEMYLYPVPESSDIQMRVFGKKYDNIDDAPVSNSLQRIIVDHIKSGGHFHNGGALLFPEDMKWGSKVYRK